MQIRVACAAAMCMVGTCHHDGAGRQHGHLLRDTGAKERPHFAVPMRRRAHDDEVVGAEFVLIENAAGGVGRGFQFQDDRSAVFMAVLDLVVPERVTPGLSEWLIDAVQCADISSSPVSISRPCFRYRMPGKLQPPIEHVLPGDPDLQTRQTSTPDRWAAHRAE